MFDARLVPDFFFGARIKSGDAGNDPGSLIAES